MSLERREHVGKNVSDRRRYMANTVARQMEDTVEDDSFDSDSTGVSPDPTGLTPSGRPSAPVKRPSKIKVFLEQYIAELLVGTVLLGVGAWVVNLQGDFRELKGRVDATEKTLPSHKDLDDLQRESRSELDRLDQELRRELERLEQRLAIPTRARK